MAERVRVTAGELADLLGQAMRDLDIRSDQRIDTLIEELEKLGEEEEYGLDEEGDGSAEE